MANPGRSSVLHARLVKLANYIQGSKIDIDTATLLIAQEFGLDRKSIAGILSDSTLSKETPSDGTLLRDAQIQDLLELIERRYPGNDAAHPEDTATDEQDNFSSVKPSALSDRAADRDNDLLGYEVYARSLIDFLTHRESQPPYSVAITGGWGIGKTTLLSWIYNELTLRNYETSWFSAWRHDKRETVWAAFARQLIDDTLTPKRRWQLYFSRLQDEYSLKWFLVPLLMALLIWDLPEIFSRFQATDYWAEPGIAIFAKIAALLALLPAFWPAIKAIRSPAVGLLKKVKGPDYGAVLGFQGEFERDLKRLVRLSATPNRPLFIFIDDLDRAPLPTSVEIIEAMNLLLGEEDCVFIVGLDLDIVAASIEAKYRDVITQLERKPRSATLFSGREFLEKMFQIVFTVPPLTKKQFNGLVEALLNAKNPDEKKPERTDKQKARGSIRWPIVDFDENKMIEEGKQRDYLEKYSDSQEAANAMRFAARFMHPNPRKLKRFMNTYRLLAFLANRRELNRSQKMDLGKLALVVLLALEYPKLFRIFQGAGYQRVFGDFAEQCRMPRSLQESDDISKKNESLMKLYDLGPEDFAPDRGELYLVLASISDHSLYLSLSAVIDDKQPRQYSRRKQK